MADYKLHDRDGYLEFILGMFFHTREQRGKADKHEIAALLPEWPIDRLVDFLDAIGRHGQVTT